MSSVNKNIAYEICRLMDETGLAKEWIYDINYVDSDDFISRVEMDAAQRVCSFYVNEAVEKTNQSPTEIAWHEVLHVLLYPLIHAAENGADDSIICGMEHKVINNIIHFLDINNYA